MLDELGDHAGNRPAIRMIRDDLVDALPAVTEGATVDVITCMRDTVLHLPTRDSVTELFTRVATILSSGGSFILTYRDLTQPLQGLDRFLPVRGEADRIMLCALDYPDCETATITDLVWIRTNDEWDLHKSCYSKLRLAPDWLRDQLTTAGLKIAHHGPGAGGMWATVATKPA